MLLFMNKTQHKPFRRVVPHATGSELASNHSSSVGRNVIQSLMEEKENAMEKFLTSKGWSQGVRPQIDHDKGHKIQRDNETKRSPS